MRIAAVIFASLVCVAATSGCKSRIVSCKQTDEEYASAREVPPLQAPPGLESPDTRNALKIPPLSTPERPRGRDEPCLDAPPPFATSKPAEGQNPR